MTNSNFYGVYLIRGLPTWTSRIRIRKFVLIDSQWLTEVYSMILRRFGIRLMANLLSPAVWKHEGALLIDAIARLWSVRSIMY